MSSARSLDAFRKLATRAFALVAVVSVIAAGSSAQIIPGDGARHEHEHQGFSRALIFFPPLPPPLDPSVPVVPPAAIHPSAPGELAEFVGEVFYPQLSTQLYEQTVPNKQRQQLASYRATKLALQQEIQRELARLRDADPGHRRETFAALARRQAAPLAALEKTAEQLRASLIASDRAWSSHREWRLSDPESRAFSPWEIAQVMRSYAFYEKHLSLTQRALLREIAYELGLAEMSAKAAAAAQTHVFFSPSPARIRWRDDASAGVTALFATYQTKKAKLKKELYDAITRRDGGAIFRGGWLADLAAKQASDVAALESLAEEIRRGLPQLPAFDTLPRTSLPPRLAEEIAALQRRRHELRKEATLQLEAISTRLREQQVFLRVNFRFEIDGLKFVVVPTRQPVSQETRQGVQTVGAEISAIADTYGSGIAGLANAEDALRAEIATVIGDSKPMAVDDAFNGALQSVEANRNAQAFVEYHAAVFEPGLSPEQRRVLFDGAIEKFDLPLPRGEPQAWRRNEKW